MASAAKIKSQQGANKPEVAPANNKYKQNIYLFVVLAIVGCVLSGVLSCGFVNYDDELYIKNNLLLRSLTWTNVWSIFSAKGIYGGNYHPLVTLTNLIEYSLAGYNAYLYHLDNLLIHLINTFLVYVLVLKISDQKYFVALFTSLMFGIHPMHVESVAWISERKDVLYSMFYLLSIIQYLNYTDKNKRLNYALSVFFFLLALLSKSMAITLPFVLWAITFYRKGRADKKFYVHSIPYILLSFAFGAIALYSQGLQGYIADFDFSAVDKFFLATYSWVYYLVRLFVPVDLSALHPFPKNGLGWEYYMSAVVLIGVIITMIFMKSVQWRRLLLFGLVFYTVSISVVLQIISVGGAVVSERYTYLAYVGLFYVIATVLDKWYPRQKGIVTAVVFLSAGCMSYTAARRVPVWEDGEALWRDATEKNPETADYAWYGLGNILNDKHANPAEVIDAYNKAIEINPGFPKYYLTRGIAKSGLKDFNGALHDINKALALQPDQVTALYDRGTVYEDLHKFDSAIIDYSRAIQLNPNYTEAFFNRAVAYRALQKYDSALADYDSVITINPAFVDAYTNSGNIYFSLKKYEKAIANFSKSLAYDARQTAVYIERGIAKFTIGMKEEACNDFKRAADLGDNNGRQAMLSLCK